MSVEKTYFAQVPRMLIRDKRLPPVARLVFAYVADIEGTNGDFFRKVERIAFELGVSEATARRSLMQLWKHGYLARKAQDGKVTHYRVEPKVWERNNAFAEAQVEEDRKVKAADPEAMFWKYDTPPPPIVPFQKGSQKQKGSQTGRPSKKREGAV